MSRLRGVLRGNAKAELEQWLIAKAQSEAYIQALSIEAGDVALMEDQDRVLIVELPQVCKIVAKRVCSPEADGRPSFGADTPGWYWTLQARLEEEGQFSCGGGTSYFTTVDSSMHEKIIQKLQHNAFQIKEERIWP